MGKTSRLPPGFRFHPTDVELVMYYLKKKVMRKRFRSEPIAEIDIYKFAPWDLPERSSSRSGDLKWYFFCPVERKYLNGARMNRATEFGYWKTTGKDRPVHYSEELVGLIKTLIFHLGKPPRGQRTNWVMHEYRLEEKYLANNGVQNTHVLCMIFQKDGPGPRNGAQYGAPFKEQDWNDDEENCVEAGPSVRLSTPTCVLPGNCSSSVLAVDSALCGTVSESCLSETMRSDCERLPAAYTNDIVSKELPQALGDGDMLPAVLANDDDNILSVFASFIEDATLISNEDEKNEDDWYDDEENCVEAGPSIRLSTPTCVLPGNCSSSVMAVNSALVGTVSESCLSETMRSDCERLPATCTNEIVSKELPQAIGDGDILPAVLVNDDDNVLSVFASFMEDATLISNEDDKNKNLGHGVNHEAAHDFDIYKDLEDLGNTASPSKNGYNFYNGQQAIFPPDLRIGITDLDPPLDAFPGLPQ
ncbi:hypothetical protein I3843_04G078000 [Carya illinoinensis]|nr:hypothetical protein I3843_04G078000 [Carya illinoinensis]